MTSRRLQALRNLAERPGTEAEGNLAREILARIEKDPRDPLDDFRDFLRSGSLNDLARAVGDHVCDCGTRYPAFTKCPNVSRHEELRAEALRRFPRGTRSYYNKWAYSRNCPCVVKCASPQWNWMRVKFDHLKSARSIPIYSADGWHLSTEPITDIEALRVLRGGMKNIDRTPITQEAIA